MFVLTKIDFCNSPLGSMRFNEARSLKDDSEVVRLIKSGLLGDAYYHVVEPDDARMDGFTRATGQPYHSIPLAADKTLMSHAVPDADMNKMTHENAMRWYRFDPFKIRAREKCTVGALRAEVAGHDVSERSYLTGRHQRTTGNLGDFAKRATA